MGAFRVGTRLHARTLCLVSVRVDPSARFNGAMASSPPRAAPRTPDLALFAREVAGPRRAAMLGALMDGRAWTVGELARVAGVARNTASGHVERLVAAGLVTATRQGRHRYVTLAGQHVADALEAMSLVAPVRPAAGLRGVRADAELAAARTCYRHLAGALGVALADRWHAHGLVTDEWALTPTGRAWCEDVGIDTTPDPRRGLLRPCLDWTERRPHAAGPLADRLAAAAFARGWIVRGVHPRAVVVTPEGRRALGLGG